MLSVTSATLERLCIADWFALTTADLERLACALLGEHPQGRWVRQGSEHAVIASVKLGSLATKLDAELSALAADTKKIRSADGEPAALRAAEANALVAAAVYHLRFENIHPLLEGNGRVGRTILAAQLQQADRIPVAETFAQLNAHSNDYMMAFPSNQPAVMFELLLDVLARLTGMMLPEEASQLPVSILPIHPDRRPVVKNQAQQIRPIMPIRPAQRGGEAFRKFR